jgi:hypothetical protein
MRYRKPGFIIQVDCKVWALLRKYFGLFSNSEHQLLATNFSLALTVCGLKSTRKSLKPWFFAFFPQPPFFTYMPQPPHTPRVPLQEVSPNSRSRVVALHDYGMKYCDISRGENLPPSTCRQIFKNAPLQESCKSRPRSGRPQSITPRLGRRIFRAINFNPKITAAQLRAEVAPEYSKKTIYRFLKKSGIQKWRCKKRPGEPYRSPA